MKTMRVLKKKQKKKKFSASLSLLHHSDKEEDTKKRKKRVFPSLSCSFRKRRKVSYRHPPVPHDLLRHGYRALFWRERERGGGERSS